MLKLRWALIDWDGHVREREARRAYARALAGVSPVTLSFDVYDAIETLDELDAALKAAESTVRTPSDAASAPREADSKGP